MTVANPTYLHDLAEQTLAAAVKALTDNGITPPDSRFISPGDVADDCDNLSVRILRIFTGTPGNEVAAPEQCGYARTVELAVRIVRCIKGIHDDEHAPSDDEQTDDALTTYTDIWVIHQGILQQVAQREYLDLCQNILVGNAVYTGPEGGIGGWELTIQVQVT